MAVAAGQSARGQLEELLKRFDSGSPKAQLAKLRKRLDSKTPVEKRARLRLLKNDDSEDERYVLGVVLEPETVDTQLDIYSAEEIRAAAHRFMEEYRSIGFMHEYIVTEQIKILESYIAPVDFELDGEQIKQGSWLLALRIVDEELWEQDKSGEINAFSIGGDAFATPDEEATAAQEEAA